MLSTLVWSLVPKSLTSFLVTSIAVYLVYRWFELKYRYRTLPKPPGLPFVGHLFLFIGNPFRPDGKKVHQRAYQNLIKAAHDFAKEGVANWFLVNKPMVMIFKPSHIEKLLSSTEEIEKGEDYKYMAPWLAEGLLLSTGKYWKARRRIISPAFHFSILNDFIPIFAQCAGRLADRLQDEHHRNGFVRDLMGPVERTALEVVSQTSIGITLDAIEGGSEDRLALDYSKSLAAVVNGAFERTFNPFWSWDFVFYRSRTGRLYRKSVKLLASFMDQVVAERIAQLRQKRAHKKAIEEQREEDVQAFYGKGKRKKAFLDLLVETHLDQEEQTGPELPAGQRLDLHGIREEVNTFTFAGFDTTSSSLVFLLYLLGLHPEIQQKAYEEVVEVLGTGNDDGEENASIDLETIGQLKYLEACIKESLRLITTVPIITRHLHSDLHLDNGCVIPAGTDLSVSIVGLHTSPVYYERPDEYRPERFFEPTADRSAYAFIPFSAGSRNCIGQRFAMTNLKTSIAFLLRKLRFQSLTPLHEMKNRFEIVTKPDAELPVRVYPRK